MSDVQAHLSQAQRELLAKRLQRARAKEVQPQTIVRRPEGEPLTLSFAQRRMWFLHQWEPDSFAYNIPGALRLTGRLDVSALRQALNAIVRRHQVLQMTYTALDEEPTQIPHPEPTLAVEMVDLSALPTRTREAEVHRLTTGEAKRPFNLAHDLPIRASLLRLGQTEHLLVLTIHHIATDGWSTGILVKELATLYQAFCAGQPAPLPELPIQYADYACWQRNWLSGEVLDKQLAYWKKRLAGAPAVLELPTDRQRPPVQTSHGAMHYFRLSPSLTQAVKNLSQQEGVTPFMTLLAVLQALLQRYSGQNDIMVGSPIANRNRSEIEGLIGFFVNTLVLRTDLAGDPSVRELLQRVRQVTLEAYTHQDLPFEKLVQELQPERHLSHNPLFQIMFNYHNTPWSPPELPDLTLEYLDIERSATKFDASLAAEQVGDEILCNVTYNTDLFDLDTIRHMMNRFQVLLEEAVAYPERRLSELPLITPAERAHLLEAWCNTAATYPDVQCVHQLFEEQVARTPDAVAVIFEAQRYSYRELNQRANQVAHYLQSLGFVLRPRRERSAERLSPKGVGPEVRVGLFMERSLDILVGLIGILKAGGAYVPLDPLYPPDRVRFMLNDVQVSVLVTEAALADTLSDLGGVQVVCLDRDWDTIARHSDANPPLAVTPANLIYVLFTSGSTGRPKGVAVEHRNYLNYYHGVLPRLKLRPGLSFALVSTFSTDLGTIQFWAPLTTGGTVHVFSYARATDPDALAEYFRRHQIDVLKLVPSHFDALQGAPDSDALVPRHLLIFTGEASHWETVARVKALNPDCMIQDHYGVTETTCATLVYTAPDAVPAQRAATLPLGQPLGNVRVYTLDERLEPTPVGVPGELYIGGLGVTRGYVGRPELTAERFVPDPFPPPLSPPQGGMKGGEAGARLYRTGDLAYFRADGRLRLLGRIDHQVKIRGYRVEIGEIETLLSEHPTVQDAVVMARDAERTPGDQRLVAYVVPHPEHAAGFAIPPLRDALRAQLPDYMVPAVFVILDAIPLNPNGKVDRFALPAPDPSRPDLADSFVAPRNEIEEHLAAIWRQVLDIDQVGIDDNFFDVGGESFKAIRVVRKIGASVSVIELFRRPTIRELAGYLSNGQPKSDGLLQELTKPVLRGEKKLSLVCVPYGGGSAIMFQPLADALPLGYSLYAVELPGHDYSRRDEALQPLEQVARQCVKEIKRDVIGPIALYGHCVGGALAIEMARLLEKDGIEIAGIFLGGTFPSPRLPGKLFGRVEKLLDRWASSRSIYDSLRALGGFTDALDPQERAFVLRSLRHDADAAQDYYTGRYANPEGAKVEAPILCVVGQMDRATELYQERFKEWEFFSAAVDLAVIERAGHYFLKHQADELARVIASQSAVWRDKVRGQAQLATSSAAATASLRAAGVKQMRKRDDPGKRATVLQSWPSLNIFFLVALGQFVSLVGTGLTSFALGVWVYQQTGSVSDLGFIWFFVGLPGILFAPIAGAIADRQDRRRIMIMSDTAAACGTLALVGLLWTDTLQIWHIYAVVGIGSIANTFQEPAYMAAIAQLVPKQYLGHANGIVQLGGATGRLLAPLLGGVLVVLIGLPGIVLIDLITFLFAITTLMLVRFPNTLFRKREEPFIREIVGGWAYIIKRRGFLALTATFAVSNFLQSVVRVLITPMVLLFESPATLGTVMAANGIGMLIGSLVMSVWGGTKRRIKGSIGFMALLGLSTLVMGLRPSPLYVAVGLFGMGLAAALSNAHWLALIQTKVGLELQGRVVAADNLISWSIQPLGFILAGPLSDRIFEPLMSGDGPVARSLGTLIGLGPGRGMGLMMILAGVVSVALTITAYRYRPLRLLEDILPDAIPEATIAADKDELQRQADRQLLAEVV